MKLFKLKLNKPQNFFKTLVRLLSYYKGIKGLILVIVVLLTIFSSLASIIGTFKLQDVISTILEIKNGTATYSDLINSIILMGSLYLGGVLSTLIYNQLMIRTSQKVIANIRLDLIKETLALPLSEFDKHTHGEFMTYFTNDIDTLNTALNDSFANFVFSLANIIGTLVGLFLLNIYLSLIVVFFLALMLIFIIFNSIKCRKYFNNQQTELSKMNGFIEENINGTKVEKAFNHEKENYEKFFIRNKNLQEVSTKAFFHTQLNIPVIVALSYFNFAISCVLGVIFSLPINGVRILKGGVPALTSYLVFVRQSAQPFNFITQHINAILTALAGAERIFNYLDKPHEIDEGNVTLVKLNDDPNSKDHLGWAIPLKNGETKLVPLKGDIRFNNVTFSYVPNKIVLDNISLYAKPGEKIAFVGSTGAGKTTIISLISRFYEINSGTITYDGINIKDIKKESLRRSISMVTQDTHLFTGSIKDNIRYVRRHSTDIEVIKASKIANADSFIKRLPNGYDTLLFDDGHNLSEGQRQLLALARAAISKPPVLILDEATSNIDTHTEELVEQSMDKLMENRTVLVIAHRLSTVRNSDAILCLEHGKIIERGTHDELIKMKGYYYNLYKGISELD